MKKLNRVLLSMMLTVSLLFGMFPAMVHAEEETSDPVAATPVSGVTTVEAGKTYSVSNAQELLAFAALCTAENSYFKDATVVLTNDIDLNPGWTAGDTTPTTVWTPVSFKGTFDGQGHTLSGIRADDVQVVTKKDGTLEYVSGLFAVLWENVTVKDLVIENSFFKSAKGYAGALAGALADDGKSDRNLIIENVTVRAKIVGRASHTGGFIGMAYGYHVAFTGCLFDGEVDSDKYNAGGFIGQNAAKAIFTDCVSRGSVTASGGIGGFIGVMPTWTNLPVEFYRCVSMGELKTSQTGSTTDNKNWVIIAGFVGETLQSVKAEDCLSMATISAPFQATTSGFIGSNGDNTTAPERPIYQFTRCVSASKMSNSSTAYRGYWFGRLNKEKEFGEGAVTGFEWTDSYAVGENNTWSVGVWRTDAFKRDFTFAYTVRSANTEGAVNDTHEETFTMSDGNQAKVLSNAKANRYSVLPTGIQLSGTNALFYLAAFDFADTWMLVGDEQLPMPRTAAKMVYGQKDITATGVDFYGYQLKATEEGGSVRLIATIGTDALETYSKVGFRINALHTEAAIKENGNSSTLQTAEIPYNTTLANSTVYRSVLASSYIGNEGPVTEEVSVDGKYLVVWCIDNIPGSGNAVFEIQTYGKLSETGEEILGDVWVALVKSGQVVSVYLK